MPARCVDCKRTTENQHACTRCKEPLHNLCGATHKASVDFDTYCCKCNSEKGEACSAKGKHVQLNGMEAGDLDALDDETIRNCVLDLSLAEVQSLSAQHDKIHRIADTLNNHVNEESYKIGEKFRQQMNKFDQSLCHESWVDKRGNCGPGMLKILNE